MRAIRSRRAIHFAKSEKKNLGNPFRFPTPKLPRRGFSHALFIAAPAIIVGGFYWLFFSPAFAIEKIEIKTNATPARYKTATAFTQQLNKMRWGVIPQTNMFAFDSRTLENNLADQLTTQQIFTEKIRPHTIAITISETPREILWSSRNKIYALDTHGRILGPPAGNPRPETPIIYDRSANLPLRSDQVLTPQQIMFITEIMRNNMIKELNSDLIIIAQAKAPDITVRVGGYGTQNQIKWYVYFNTLYDAHAQLKNLDLTLRHSIPPDRRTDLEYIDLRFGERVYFKYR